MVRRDHEKYQTFKETFPLEFSMFEVYSGFPKRLSSTMEWARALGTTQATISAFIRDLTYEGVISKEQREKRRRNIWDTKTERLTPDRSEVEKKIVSQMISDATDLKTGKRSKMPTQEEYGEQFGLDAQVIYKIEAANIPRNLKKYINESRMKQGAIKRQETYGHRKELRLRSLEDLKEFIIYEFQEVSEGRRETFTKNDALAKIASQILEESGIEYPYNSNSISRYLQDLVEAGVLTEKDLTYRRKEITNYSLKTSLTGRMISDETKRRISNSNKGKKISDETRERLSVARRKRKTSDETKEKMSMSHKGTKPSAETRKKMSEASIRNNTGKWLAEYIQKKYEFDGHYYPTKTEGATAIALKKYIPDFEIIEGETFQAQKDTRLFFDFYIPRLEKIVEWHPINIGHDGKRLPQDLEALRELEKNVTPKEKGALSYLKNEFKGDLAVEYWMERQEASDASTFFKGSEVILIRTPGELYDQVIKKYGEVKKIPSRNEFIREFYDQIIKLPKPVEKIKQESVEEAA